MFGAWGVYVRIEVACVEEGDGVNALGRAARDVTARRHDHRALPAHNTTPAPSVLVYHPFHTAV